MSDTPVPDASTNTEGWWSTHLHIWWRDFDELGHMTAAAYPATFEEGVGRFVTERWGQDSPAYATAHTTIAYVHEVLRKKCPVTLAIRPARVGRTSFTLDLVLSNADGTRCAIGRTRYVAWDREARSPRVLTEAERAALQAPAT